MTRKAQSIYKQMRLTYTEEASGVLSVSIYVKPLNAAWNEQQCLWRYSVRDAPPAGSMEHLAERIIFLLEDAFPGVTRRS